MQATPSDRKCLLASGTMKMSRSAGTAAAGPPGKGLQILLPPAQGSSELLTLNIRRLQRPGWFALDPAIQAFRAPQVALTSGYPVPFPPSTPSDCLRAKLGGGLRTHNGPYRDSIHSGPRVTAPWGPLSHSHMAKPLGGDGVGS